MSFGSIGLSGSNGIGGQENCYVAADTLATISKSMLHTFYNGPIGRNTPNMYFLDYDKSTMTINLLNKINNVYESLEFLFLKYRKKEMSIL